MYEFTSVAYRTAVKIVGANKKCVKSFRSLLYCCLSSPGLQITLVSLYTYFIIMEHTVIPSMYILILYTDSILSSLPQSVHV